MAVSTVWWITMEAPRRLMGARGVRGPKCLPPGSPRGAGYLPNILIMDQRLTVQGIKNKTRFLKKNMTGIIPAWKKNPSHFFFKSTNPHKNCDKTKNIEYYCIGLTA